MLLVTDLVCDRPVGCEGPNALYPQVTALDGLAKGEACWENQANWTWQGRPCSGTKEMGCHLYALGQAQITLLNFKILS